MKTQHNLESNTASSNTRKLCSSTRKRSRHINLDRMRKNGEASTAKSAFTQWGRPLAVGMAATGLVACGNDTQDAIVYQSVDDCSLDNPGLSFECETAYKKALKEAANSGPKYSSEYACTADFGPNNCVPYSRYAADGSGSNWFIPAMAGFLFSQYITNSNSYGYYSSPLYTSYSRHSPFYGHWTTVDGYDYGRVRYGRMKVDKDAFKPKTAVRKTISRGGFGSKVAAKSNWGGSRSSSRSSWGG